MGITFLNFTDPDEYKPPRTSLSAGFIFGRTFDDVADNRLLSLRSIAIYDLLINFSYDTSFELFPAVHSNFSKEIFINAHAFGTEIGSIN